MKKIKSNFLKNFHKKVSFFNTTPPKKYYQILQVEKNANSEQIKQSFFKLAKKYHPDTNPSESEKFKEINEAYQVLSNMHEK